MIVVRKAIRHRRDWLNHKMPLLQRISDEIIHTVDEWGLVHISTRAHTHTHTLGFCCLPLSPIKIWQPQYCALQPIDIFAWSIVWGKQIWQWLSWNFFFTLAPPANCSAEGNNLPPVFCPYRPNIPMNPIWQQISEWNVIAESVSLKRCLNISTSQCHLVIVRYRDRYPHNKTHPAL